MSEAKRLYFEDPPGSLLQFAFVRSAPTQEDQPGFVWSEITLDLSEMFPAAVLPLESEEIHAKVSELFRKIVNRAQNPFFQGTVRAARVFRFALAVSRSPSEASERTYEE
jgi:hypothetical protein